jgi:hypothetical protein
MISDERIEDLMMSMKSQTTQYAVDILSALTELREWREIEKQLQKDLSEMHD